MIVALAALLVVLLPGAVCAQDHGSDQAILRATWLLQRNPHDARAYHRLGDAYIRKSRETGDVAYLSRAEDALRKALAIAPDLGGASRHLAYALYLRHAFDESAVQARRAIALDPADAHAHGILADAQLEVGDYEEANAAYQQMMRLGADLYALARRAGWNSLRGDAASAIEDLERAIRAGRETGRPAESIAWAEWQLGVEHFAVGNLAAADVAYQRALETYPGYHRALAGLAQIRAAQARYPEAIELYRRAIAVVPLPDYAAGLGDVHGKLGQLAGAKRQYELVEYIGYLNSLNKVLYNRELAYFYADHDVKLVEALALAQHELEVRHDVYAYDLLAWTLYKNGRARDAVAPMREALKLGTRDARLYFHAGMIHRELGDVDVAIAYLRRALSTNRSFHVLLADVAARALTELESAELQP